MKTLIIGGAGFAGGYLIRELSSMGHEVHATCLENENITENCAVHNLDILDKEAVCRLFGEISPDIVYHLAAQSSVALSWKLPQMTAEVNIVGAINVLEAARECGGDIKLVMIGSGEEYGCIGADSCPIKESEPLDPNNIYAVTKAAQEMAAKVYARAYHMNIVMVRAFNHSGPQQSSAFVISDFCRQIAAVECGLAPPEMLVGNLSAKRDFTDVRDIVRAYGLLAEKGVSGKVYNVGRGNAVSIQYILDTAISMSHSDIKVKRDPKRMRASDIPVIEPDVSEIFRDTGWKAEISVERTIEDTLNYWRKNLKRS